MSRRSPAESTSYTVGRVIGAILASLLLALLVRAFYVKVFARGRERPVWAGSVFVLAFAFSWLALLGTGGGRTETVDTCLRDFSAGFRDSLPPGQSALVTDERLAEAVRPACAELVRLEEEDADFDAAEAVALIARERPQLWRPLCDVRIDIEIASAGAPARFITPAEQERFREDSCRLAARFMRDDGTVDTVAFLTEHQVIYAPFCAAGFQDGVARDPRAARGLTARQVGTIARRACRQALENRVIDMAVPGGLLNPKVDEAALAAIFERATRAVVTR